MESWRRVWRDGFVPGMSTPALEALAAGLRAEDKCLKQGVTTDPPPFSCTQEWTCEGGCAVSYAGWKGDGLETVGEVGAYFANACHQADKRLGEPAACRYFLNFFDGTPRADMVPELLIEVERALAERDDHECPLCGKSMGDESGNTHARCAAYEQWQADGFDPADGMEQVASLPTCHSVGF